MTKPLRSFLALAVLFFQLDVGAVAAQMAIPAVPMAVPSVIPLINAVPAQLPLSGATLGPAALPTEFVLMAYDLAGNQGPSSPALFTQTQDPDTTAPSVPGNVRFENAGENALTLKWNASTDNVGVTGYRVDVSTVSTFASFVTGYNNKDVGNVLQATVTGLSPSTTYYGRVRVYDAVPNTSGSSAAASGTTLAATDQTPPTAPGAVSYSGVTDRRMDVHWGASVDNVGVVGYRVDVSTVSTFATFLAGYNNKDVGLTTTAAVTGLSASTTYYVRVRAYDLAGLHSGYTASSQVTSPAGSASEQNVVNYVRYNAAGLKERIEYTSGVVTEYTYDANLRVKRVRRHHSAMIGVPS